MKKSTFLVIFAAFGALFILSSQAQASYYLSGCWTTAGDYDRVGSLYSVVNPGTFTPDDLGDPSYHYDGIKNAFEREYVLVTGSNGSAAFSGGELNPLLGNRSVNLLSDGLGGYNLASYDSRDVTGVSSITVVHAVYSPTGERAYSPSLTVTGGGLAAPVTKTDAELSATHAAGTSTSLIGLLGEYGVNAAGLSPSSMIIFKSADYATMLSVGELLNVVSPDMVTFYAYTGTPSSPGNGYVRLMRPYTDTAQEGASARTIGNLTSIEIIPTPIPASLLLFAPGLLALIGLRKRSRH